MSGRGELQGLPPGLLSALAHELRTPLAVILGYTELIETRDDEGTRLEATKRIREAAERLTSTIDRLISEAEESP